jgi:hypothetical protein
MLPLVPLCQCEVLVRRLLSFLNEPVQKNHLLLSVYIEQHASDTVLRKVGADLIDAIPSGRQSGMPKGQPNSTVLISAPMRLRSSS